MTNRTDRVRKLQSWLRAEALESRDVPSPFFDLQTVASTADGFVGFGDLPSINDKGTVLTGRWDCTPVTLQV